MLEKSLVDSYATLIELWVYSYEGGYILLYSWESTLEGLMWNWSLVVNTCMVVVLPR